MTSRRTRPRLTTAILREDVRGARLTVNRDAGEIQGVKVLGLESANGRRYTPEALKRAVRLYEGKAVNIDHPKRPGDQRSAYDRFGRLHNVEVRADGLYATLRYLKTHPMAERICEAAERMPEAFGLSHNAEGKGRADKGVFVVEEITSVRSVDLVADPATTKSLSEGTAIAKKLREALAALLPAESRRLRRLLEDDGPLAGMADEPVDAPIEAPAEDEGYEAHIGRAVTAIVQDESLSTEEKRKKVLMLLKLMDDEPAESSASGSTPEEKDDEEEKDDDKSTKESRRIKASTDPAVKALQEQVAEIARERDTLKREQAVLAECRTAGITTPSAGILKALNALGDKTDRKALLDEYKTAMRRGTGPGGPRSSAPGTPIQEARDDRIPDDPAQLSRWLQAA